MKYFIIIISSFFCCIGKQKIKIQVDENQTGWCYLFITDSESLIQVIHLDSNNMGSISMKLIDKYKSFEVINSLDENIDNEIKLNCIIYLTPKNRILMFYRLNEDEKKLPINTWNDINNPHYRNANQAQDSIVNLIEQRFR